jgi:uncharacterized OB-fold protein
MNGVVSTALDVLLVVAVGGMLWSAVSRLRRRQITVPRCPGCGRTTSRAYERCPRCGEPTPTVGP